MSIDLSRFQVNGKPANGLTWFGNKIKNEADLLQLYSYLTENGVKTVLIA